jgi:hypothetical protein
VTTRLSSCTGHYQFWHLHRSSHGPRATSVGEACVISWHQQSSRKVWSIPGSWLSQLLGLWLTLMSLYVDTSVGFLNFVWHLIEHDFPSLRMSLVSFKEVFVL